VASYGSGPEISAPCLTIREHASDIKIYIPRAATCAPFVTKILYTPVFSPLSCKKNISFTTAVPTLIMPPNPNPHNALVPSKVLKSGAVADPTPPRMVIRIARSVMGRRP
jgi:hypothetical protein